MGNRGIRNGERDMQTCGTIFVSLRVAATRRFVSAADDDTRKGEAEMDAQLRRSLRECADSSVSIA